MQKRRTNMLGNHFVSCSRIDGRAAIFQAALNDLTFKLSLKMALLLHLSFCLALDLLHTKRRVIKLNWHYYGSAFASHPLLVASAHVCAAHWTPRRRSGCGCVPLIWTASVFLHVDLTILRERMSVAPHSQSLALI